MKVQAARKKKEADEKNRLQKKQQWEQSEAVYHIQEKRLRETEPYLKGFSDKERDTKKPGRMREIFKAENSYGAITAGVNKKKEAAIVFSQKREHDGPVAAESQKNLHMERAERRILPAGNMYLNPDMEKEGAAAFFGKELPAKKAMAQIRRYADETGSRMMEQRMPFLELKEERAQAARLEQQRRRSRETGDFRKAQMLEDRVEQMRSRITKKEQAGRQMMKKLREAWKKTERMKPDDFFRRDGEFLENMQRENTQKPPESENPGGEEKNKNAENKN